MQRRHVLLGGIAAAIILVFALAAFAIHRHHHHHHNPRHVATCWSKPGRFVAGGHGRFVFTPQGRRHGPGHVRGICDKGLG